MTLSLLGLTSIVTALGLMVFGKIATVSAV